MRVRSPLIWFGGKAKIASKIVAWMPEHKSYIEVFGGAAHVICAKPKIKHEIYNDIDGEVVNFLMMVRDNPVEMQEACESIPYSRKLYEQWKKEPLPDDKFLRAVRWFYLNRSGIAKGNAKSVPDTGWRHSAKPGTNPASSYINATKLFQTFSERLKGVMIECLDFREIIRKYDRQDALFYVDPPYFGREHRYAGGFSMQDHIDLAEMLNNIKGKAIVSYYDEPILDDLYLGWEKEYISGYKQVVNGGNLYPNEVLLMNFQKHSLMTSIKGVSL